MKINDNIELEANIIVTSSAQLLWIFGGDNKPTDLSPNLVKMLSYRRMHEIFKFKALLAAGPFLISGWPVFGQPLTGHFKIKEQLESEHILMEFFLIL